MSEIKKIYKIYEGQLAEADVEKVTKKLVWIGGVREFGYCRTHPKEYVCVTPLEAVMEEYNRSLEIRGAAKDRMKYARKRFNRACELKLEYKE